MNPLLYSFLPVISAISGNIGLQASSIHVRALACGYLTARDFGKAGWRTFIQSAYLAIGSALVIGSIAGVWSKESVFGVTVAIG